MDSKEAQGWIVFALAWSAGLSGLFCVFAGAANNLPVLIVLGLLLSGASVWLNFRYRKYFVPSATELLARDKRQPVVYLRSFADEAGEYSLRGYVKSRFARGLPNVHDPSDPWAYDTWGPKEQEKFAESMQQIGPYIALARPGEPLADVGAAWLRVPDDKWQETVASLVSRAALIVVQAGRTAGLGWEIAQLHHLCSPQRVLMILPRWQSDYEAFRSWSKPLFPVPLPEKLPPSRLLTFGNDWKPVAIDAEGPLLSALSHVH